MKRPPLYTMRRNVYKRILRRDGSPPHCMECGKVINEGDDYVSPSTCLSKTKIHCLEHGKEKALI